MTNACSEFAGSYQYYGLYQHRVHGLASFIGARRFYKKTRLKTSFRHINRKKIQYSSLNWFKYDAVTGLKFFQAQHVY